MYQPKTYIHMYMKSYEQRGENRISSSLEVIYVVVNVISGGGALMSGERIEKF